MEKTKGISFKVVLAIIIAVIVILAIIFVVAKNKSNETNDRLEKMAKEEEIIQNVASLYTIVINFMFSSSPFTKYT